MAWSLAAPEANLCRGSTKHTFFTQYAEHLSMTASDNLLSEGAIFQLCGRISESASEKKSIKRQAENWSTKL